MNTPIFDVGDLVIRLTDVKESDMTKIWRIDHKSVKHSVVNGRRNGQITYKITELYSGEVDTENEEYLLLLASKNNAEKYLKLFESPEEREKIMSTVKEIRDTFKETVEPVDGVLKALEEGEMIVDGEVVKVSNVKISTLKNPTISLTRQEKEETLNDLLDRYNDCLRFIELDGEANEFVQRQMDEIERDLKLVSRAVIIKRGR